MEAAEYVRMAEVQDRHWWFEAKRRTVAALLAHHAGGAAQGDAARPVLEVGTGTGAMTSVMRRQGRLFATDAYLPALRLLKERRSMADGRPGVSAASATVVGAVAEAPEAVPVGGDLRELPFTAAAFMMIGCFDVLYHRGVPDVTDALRELHRVCEPGGYLAITDSAFPGLRSSHDVATHAARRFRLPELVAQLESVGFAKVHASYFHTLLFPAAAAMRLTKRLLQGTPDLEGGRSGETGRAAEDSGSPSSDVTEVPPNVGRAPAGTEGAPVRSDLSPVPGWLNALLLGLYRLETPLVVRARMPFGTSLIILARRPA